MNEFQWLELQNGSDIRGIASEGKAGENVNLTPERVTKIAIAFVNWLHGKTGLPVGSLQIGVGRDSRISGPALMHAFMQGIASMGAHPVDCGLASTPAMYMGTIFGQTRFEGSVMLTASHLPFNRNGIKFFTIDGGLDKPDITQILKGASEVQTVQVSSGIFPTFDLMKIYAAHLVTKVRKEVNHPGHYDTPLTGFHIVVDAGNGSGGFYVDQVLKPLGADTRGSQFLNPDGMFPNHIPNPEDETAMTYIEKAVLKSSADLGIIFDTDVDRAAIVDHMGNSINRNELVALTAAIILGDFPGSTIVTDSITSDGLTEFIEKELNGKHHRFRRGYKNVINEAIRLNNKGEDCQLAIETSGHAALKENYFLDDGAYLVTRILIKAALLRTKGNRRIMNLIDKLQVPAESKEFRIKILASDFKSYGATVIHELEKFASGMSGWSLVPNNYEGIRISCEPASGNGWFLLRLSLHDPVIPLNIESEIEGGIRNIAGKLDVFFKDFKDLDCSALKHYLNS